MKVTISQKDNSSSPFIFVPALKDYLENVHIATIGFHQMNH